MIPYLFSIEIRAGNGSDYKENALCNWLHFQNGGSRTQFSLVECVSQSRYVTLSSVGSDIPLTLCSVQVLTSKSRSTELCEVKSVKNDPGKYVIFGDICYKRFEKVKIATLQCQKSNKS